MGAGLAVALPLALALGWRCGASSSRQAEPPAHCTSIDLGREVCGECCSTRLWRAVGRLPGVRDVSSKVGDQRIVVHHDGRAGVAAQALAGIVAAQWPDARIADATTGEAAGERVWVRPVLRSATAAR